MMGLGLQSELPGGLGVTANYKHDVLDRIGGGEATFNLSKSFQLGIVRLSPSAGVNLLSADLANNDFGVPVSKSTVDRPAYELGEAINLEVGLGVSVEITPTVLFMIRASMEYLDDEITESPIVADDYLIKGMASLSYLL
jgi:outer membrane protein